MRGHYEQTKWAPTILLSVCGIVVGICSFIETDLFDNNLSYQSALEISVMIRVRLCNIFAFSQRITKTSTLSSGNFT